MKSEFILLPSSIDWKTGSVMVVTNESFNFVGREITDSDESIESLQSVIFKEITLVPYMDGWTTFYPLHNYIEDHALKLVYTTTLPKNCVLKTGFRWYDIDYLRKQNICTKTYSYILSKVMSHYV